MKNLNMLFNNKLATALYTTFQIIKLLIKKGNLNLIQQKLPINIIHQISSIQAIPIYLYPYIYKKEEKLIHEFISYNKLPT